MGYYGAGYHASGYYGAAYYRHAPAADSSCYYHSGYYGWGYFAGGYYGHCGQPPAPEPGPVPEPAYYSPGLGGSLFPRRERHEKRRRPRIDLPERQFPQEAVLVAKRQQSLTVALLEPEAATAIPLVLVSGVWREAHPGMMVMVDGMWRELVSRTSLQYKANGRWNNYE